jgi:chemotaxis protein CheX
LNKSVLDGFAEAARDVLRFMLGVEIEDAAPETAQLSGESVSVTIGLTGDISGETRFYFPRGTALSMVGIMSGMDVDCLDDFVMSAMGEMANIISGNAVTAMAARQVSCDILPPEVSVAGEPDSGETAGCMALATTAGIVYLAARLNPSPRRLG